MVPLALIELLGFIPGLPGLFMASIFSASLRLENTQFPVYVNYISSYVDIIKAIYRAVKALTMASFSPIAKLLICDENEFSMRMFTIESDKTTSIYNVSTRVLSKK